MHVHYFLFIFFSVCLSGCLYLFFLVCLSLLCLFHFNVCLLLFTKCTKILQFIFLLFLSIYLSLLLSTFTLHFTYRVRPPKWECFWTQFRGRSLIAKKMLKTPLDCKFQVDFRSVFWILVAWLLFEKIRPKWRPRGLVCAGIDTLTTPITLNTQVFMVNYVLRPVSPIGRIELVSGAKKTKNIYQPVP